MKHLRLALVVVCTLAFGTTAAMAKPKPPVDKSAEMAKQYYEDGTKYYNLGDFARAIENYKKAYEVKPDAVFLYNLGQAYRLSNDYTQAIFFYKSFLRNMPEAPNHEEVERRIKEMEDLKRLKDNTQSPPYDTVGPGGKPNATPVRPGVSTNPDTATPDTGANPDTATPDTGAKPDTGTKIPSPSDVAEHSDTGTENGTPPAAGAMDTGGHSKPIYKKWWFWGGIGAVAVVAVVVVAASSGGGSESAPGSHFGSQKVF